MKRYDPLFCLLALISALTFGLMGCKPSTSTAENPPVTHGTEQPAMKIEFMSEFPPEVDGCACYFATDSAAFARKEYILMNDYGKTTFMKIDGVIVKFMQGDPFQSEHELNTILGQAEPYTLMISVQNAGQKGDETWIKTGMIKVADEEGHSVTTPFYGVCGC